MQSILIEYFRFDNLDEAVLSKGKRYLLAFKNQKVKEVITQESHLDLLNQLHDFLRYNAGISNDDKWKTIENISDKIKDIFIDLSDYSDCQIDAVLNASELGLLPFELLLDNKSVPYFANENKKITFTRRLRQENFGNTFSVPVIPKVLFIYAHGAGVQVPFNHHLHELDKALEKWGGSGNNKIFKLLPEATFKELADELNANDSKEIQYTHIHILAHGALILNPAKPYEYEYGIAFGKKDEPVTPTKEVKKLFENLQNKPFLVNYLICDGANFSNAILPDKNPVQVTHKVGVPIVLGSQFPLSMNGSTLITKNLYKDLFEGKDIRKILFRIRKLLFDQKEYHDWVSLVAYVRLPENYYDELNHVSLKCMMQNLTYLKSKTDEYLEKSKFVKDDFLDSMYGLSDCVKSLDEKLEEIKNDSKYQEEALENIGLLGSAYKRMAELYFIGAKIKDPVTEADIESKKALQKSLEYYRLACQKNLSHHWSLVQFLSLDVILNGQISDMGYWHAARTSIRNSTTVNPTDGWTYGSLIELLLLQTSSEEDKEEVSTAINTLIKIAKEEKNSFLLESTWSQLNRYKIWWNSDNGFNINKSLQVTDMIFLEALLKELRTAIDEFKTQQ
jgi:hypothetical protein